MSQAWEGYGVRVVREPQLPYPKPKIDGPAGAVEILRRQLPLEDREVFVAVLMDARNQVLGINTVSIGSLTTSIVHPREVFRPAVGEGAAALILVHNHPSGDPTPSAEDRAVTRQLVDAGRVLGIPVLDHVVVGRGSYRSLMEREDG